jgi:Carbamoyltransferase C-terminus
VRQRSATQQPIVQREGEPIVCTREDAYRCFMKTGMDVLVMESFMLTKAGTASAQDVSIE